VADDSPDQERPKAFLDALRRFVGLAEFRLATEGSGGGPPRHPWSRLTRMIADALMALNDADDEADWPWPTDRRKVPTPSGFAIDWARAELSNLWLRTFDEAGGECDEEGGGNSVSVIEYVDSVLQRPDLPERLRVMRLALNLTARPAAREKKVSEPFICSKSELLRALDKDETNTKYLDRIDELGELEMEPLGRRVGRWSIRARFTDPDQNDEVRRLIRKERKGKSSLPPAP
jgi:hypothetical protein